MAELSTVAARDNNLSLVIPAEGTTVGRYLVIEELGRGGTGVVLRAYDPTLHREIALKVLHHGSMSGEARERMAREGQAMAQLSHPNVVAVYDVEFGIKGIVLVMELVRGGTLTEWLRGNKHSWDDIVRVFIQAGSGLQAAHSAGLLHRDFKPGNVLIGDDGRIRVTDFGLARLHSDGPDPMATLEADSVLIAEPDQLTRTGVVMGTPLYMSPEQYDRARAVDERSDQYAFCVSLWYALVGTPPFPRTPIGCAHGKRVGPPPWPRAVFVPGRIVRAIRRGLAADPECRWPDMGMLLAELERGRRGARRKRVWMAVAGIAVAAASVDGYQRWDHTERVAACEQHGAEIESVWNETVAARTREAFSATKVPFADTMATKVSTLLDQYVEGWQDARTHACLQSDVDEVWSAELAKAAQWCLEGRKRQLEGLIEQLTTTDSMAVLTAMKAALGLPSPAPCTERVLLERMSLPSSEQQQMLRPLLAQVSRAHALSASGRYDEGLRAAQAALEHSKFVDWGPIRAQAQLAVGFLFDEKAEYHDAHEALLDAYFAAGDDAPEVAADASIRLVAVLGHQLDRFEDSEVWARFAEAAIGRLGGEHRQREALLANAKALVASKAGRYDDAKASYERALELWQDERGDDDLAAAATAQNLGLTHMRLGEYDAARAALARAHATFAAVLGQDHPDVAYVLVTFGSLEQNLGHYDEAKRMYHDALLIRERALGPDHPLVALTLNNTGTLFRELGDLDAAADRYSRALRIFERALGPDHSDVATSLYNVGTIYSARGDLEAAHDAFARSLEILELSLGPGHVDLAFPLTSLARIQRLRGDADRARELLERALKVRQQALGAEHSDVARSYLSLGELAISVGDRALAVQHFERACTIFRTALGAEHRRTKDCGEKLSAATRP
jgi:tetratricopeptide (TPR) repeat protein